MSLFATLKRNGKHALQNHWGSAIFVSFIPVLTGLILGFFYMAVSKVGLTNFNVRAFIHYHPSEVWAVVSSRPYEILSLFIVYLILVLITILLLVPLTMGVVYWFYHLVQGEPLPISGVFHFFESGKGYRKAFMLQLGIGFRRLGWGVVFFVLPSGLLVGGNVLAGWLSEGGDKGADLRLLFIMCATLLALLSLLSAVLYTAYMNKFFLAPYYIASNKEMKGREAIATSIQHTKGYRFNLLWFLLSFIGWFILSFIPFVALYTLPYLSASLALYASYIMETKKREAPVLSKEKPPVEDEILQREILPPPITDSTPGEVPPTTEPQWGTVEDKGEENLKESFANALKEGQAQSQKPEQSPVKQELQEEWVSAVLPPVPPEEKPLPPAVSLKEEDEWISAVLPKREESFAVFPQEDKPDQEWVSDDRLPAVPVTPPQPQGPVLEKKEQDDDNNKNYPALQ